MNVPGLAAEKVVALIGNWARLEWVREDSMKALLEDCLHIIGACYCVLYGGVHSIHTEVSVKMTTLLRGLVSKDNTSR